MSLLIYMYTCPLKSEMAYITFCPIKVIFLLKHVDKYSAICSLGTKWCLRGSQKGDFVLSLLMQGSEGPFLHLFYNAPYYEKPFSFGALLSG